MKAQPKAPAPTEPMSSFARFAALLEAELIAPLEGCAERLRASARLYPKLPEDFRRQADAQLAETIAGIRASLLSEGGFGPAVRRLHKRLVEMERGLRRIAVHGDPASRTNGKGPQPQ